MPYSRPQLFELSKKISRSWRTLQYWAAQGCDLSDPESVRAFLIAKELRKTNVQKAKERRQSHQDNPRRDAASSAGASAPGGNGEVLPPPGKRGAAAALQRLEEQEEHAHARLQSALESGDRFMIDACQTYWLKVAETLVKPG